MWLVMNTHTLIQTHTHNDIEMNLISVSYILIFNILTAFVCVCVSKNFYFLPLTCSFISDTADSILFFQFVSLFVCTRIFFHNLNLIYIHFQSIQDCVCS